MSPPANTPRAAGLERRRHPHGPVVLELHPGDPTEEGGVGLLAERQDHRVGGERLEPARRLWVPGLVELHQLDLQLGAVEGRDRPQPVDPHAFPLGVLGLVEMGGHLLAGPPVDDQRLVRTHPAGDPRGVHRRVAAAVDRHAPPDHGPLAGGDAAQERHRVHDAARIAGRDVHPLGEVCADGDEDRVESALVALGDQILDPVPAGHPHAHRRDPVELAGEHVAGQPVGRDAVSHHPARLLARVSDLHLVAEPAQVVGGRQTARPGADHEHPLAAADRWIVEAPPLLQREVAEEPLDRMNRDGAVEVGAVAHALARVVADPPVDRGQRIVGDQLAPRLLVSARLGVREPGLDVLAGRAAGVARRQQVDVDGAALADRAGVGTPVQQVGQRRHVPHRVVHAGRHGRTPMASSLAPSSDTRSGPGSLPSAAQTPPAAAVARWTSPFGTLSRGLE